MKNGYYWATMLAQLSVETMILKDGYKARTKDSLAQIVHVYDDMVYSIMYEMLKSKKFKFKPTMVEDKLESWTDFVLIGNAPIKANISLQKIRKSFKNKIK